MYGDAESPRPSKQSSSGALIIGLEGYEAIRLSWRGLATTVHDEWKPDRPDALIDFGTIRLRKQSWD